MKIRAAVLVAPGRYEVQTFDRPKLEDGALLMRLSQLSRDMKMLELLKS